MLSNEQLARMRETAAGPLPDTMTVLNPSTVTGADLNRKTTYVDGDSSPCRLSALTGRESIVSDSVRARAEMLLTYPVDFPLAEENRVRIGGTTYEVLFDAPTTEWRLTGRAYLARI